MTQFQIQCNNISEQRQKRIELLSESSSFSPADPPFQGQINNPFSGLKQEKPSVRHSATGRKKEDFPQAKADKLLLHVCCGPCASGCFPRLEELGRDFCFYFSNSNICSEEEYDKRLDSVDKLARILQIPLYVDPYRHDLWLKEISSNCENFEVQPERGSRCRYCFQFSLNRTAEKASELGMSFATTLTVSPHKNSSIIFEIGSQWNHFECWDFKKKDGFSKSL